MKELTDEQIIQAYRICLSEYEKDCTNCPLRGKEFCSSRMLYLIDDVLNHKDAEIEKLIAQNGVYETCNARKDEAIHQLEKEVDRLSQCVMYHDGQIVDAIKEVLERLKYELEIAFDEPIFDTVIGKIIESTIDRLIDEMAGDNNV